MPHLLDPDKKDYQVRWFLDGLEMVAPDAIALPEKGEILRYITIKDGEMSSVWYKVKTITHLIVSNNGVRSGATIIDLKAAMPPRSAASLPTILMRLGVIKPNLANKKAMVDATVGLKPVAPKRRASKKTPAPEPVK
jgi:hypothetical protein